MASTSKDQTETAPDPDEDDLDDLDDVLDEFEAKPKLPSEPKPTPSQPTTASGPGRPGESSTTAIDEDEIPDDAELQKHLQAGMSNLISELGSNPEMQQQFEDMMKELIAAGAADTDSAAAEHVKRASENMPEMPDESVKKGATSASKASGGKKEESFQETIRKTMERVQASGDAATAASTTGQAQSEDEMFAEMLKQLSAGGDGGGMGSEEDFNSMLLSMMSQLTNKEILYEPMKELNDKFPAWMEKNAGTEKAEDLERYREQQRLVGEIVERFERSGYSDENDGDREYIVERMQKMQAQGSPPQDLVGDMSAAQDALGDLDAGCPTQ